MSGNQKRDSRGRFKEKPKSSSSNPVANVSLPGKPVPAQKPERKDKNNKPKKIRLVRTPVYEPIAAVRSMSNALAPITDMRSKRKRDKARQEMENTFGDIEWEESHNDNSSDTDASSSLSSTMNHNVSQASTREELIASSGQEGALWVKQTESNSFSLAAENVKLRFIYAEDTHVDLEEFYNTDHALIEGESFTKRFHVGQIAFLSNNV